MANEVRLIRGDCPDVLRGMPDASASAAARGRAEWVATWLTRVAAERGGVWLQSELIGRAWADHVDLLA